MSAPSPQNLIRRVVGNNVWLAEPQAPGRDSLINLPAKELAYEVLDSEEAVGHEQWDEIRKVAASKQGDIVMILLGGRGSQAMYKLVGEWAKTSAIDSILSRLHVFTQDALGPMHMQNGLSFVRDFERLLGDAFFEKVKSFTPMQTDTDDLEGSVIQYLEKLRSLGGIDIFFLGLGPEAGGASHLCYIKPGSGAAADDLAGVIPISETILEHHISKFKAGGSKVSESDEAECRAATDILTLGPAAILGARRIVQSVVDASTAPAKKESYRKVIETEISTNPAERAVQMDRNPGLWLRIHPNVRSLILADVLEV